MIKIDKVKCIGCGGCSAICPDMIGFDEEGKAYIKNIKINCNEKDVVDICPVGAISYKV